MWSRREKNGMFAQGVHVRESTTDQCVSFVMEVNPLVPSAGRPEIKNSWKLGSKGFLWAGSKGFVKHCGNLPQLFQWIKGRISLIRKKNQHLHNLNANTVFVLQLLSLQLKMLAENILDLLWAHWNTEGDTVSHFIDISTAIGNCLLAIIYRGVSN